MSHLFNASPDLIKHSSIYREIMNLLQPGNHVRLVIFTRGISFEQSVTIQEFMDVDPGNEPAIGFYFGHEMFFCVALRDIVTLYDDYEGRERFQICMRDGVWIHLGQV